MSKTTEKELYDMDLHIKEGDRYYHMGRGLGTIVAGASVGNVAIDYDNGYSGQVTKYEFYMMLKYGILLKEQQNEK